MGFPPADDPHYSKGAPRKGGAGGKPRRGKPQPPASPPRQKPHRAAGAATTARPQPRRERDNASSRWRGLWARPIPREARPRGRAALFSPRLQNRLKLPKKRHFQAQKGQNRPKTGILRHFSVIYAPITLKMAFLTTSRRMKWEEH